MENPPPPYEANPSPSPTIRPTTFTTAPKEILSHYINIVLHASPLSFPCPEPSQFWVARDVQPSDWTTFVNNLLYTTTTTDTKSESSDSKSNADSEFELLQTMYATLAKWNEGFFAPRGLKVVAGGEAPATRTEKKMEVGFKFGEENKVGLQAGSVLIGLGFPESKKSEK